MLNTHMLFSKIKKLFWHYASLAPIELEKEFEPYKQYCKGIILNVGSGTRPLNLGPLHLKTDIDPTFPIDFTSDAHFIPFLNSTIDTIVTIAVLEHTRYPWKVVEEFYRVLKPGGLSIIAVPFLQPEHNMPYDYFRFTRNGIIELLEYFGFAILSTTKLFNNSRIFAWLIIENLKKQPRIIRNFSLPFCHLLSRLGKDYSKNDHSVYRGIYIIAKKPGEQYSKIDASTPEWFFPLLCCPISKKPLLKTKNMLMIDNAYGYPIIDGLPRLTPKDRIKI